MMPTHHCLLGKACSDVNRTGTDISVKASLSSCFQGVIHAYALSISADHRRALACWMAFAYKLCSIMLERQIYPYCVDCGKANAACNVPNASAVRKRESWRELEAVRSIARSTNTRTAAKSRCRFGARSWSALHLFCDGSLFVYILHLHPVP